VESMVFVTDFYLSARVRVYISSQFPAPIVVKVLNYVMESFLDL
jgi:hypothetical protein